MLLKILTTLCIMLFSVQSISGTIDPQVADHKYISYGKDFAYVVELSGRYEDGKIFGASAVLIDDHHVLTAAHVVEDSTSCIVKLNDNEFCISSFIIHENFNKERFGIADIAIGYSKEPFNLKFYPALYTEDNETGKLCSIAGYGFHGTFNIGAVSHDGKKRAGSNIIDGLEQDLLICSPSRIGDKTRTSLEFIICSGDSGGGLFIDNRLAGINSCIMAVDKSPSGKYNEESGHTRVSKFVEWINKNKRK